MKKNILQEKSFLFAKKILSFYKTLTENKEYILSKQLLRSGTSVGANIEEALVANSKKDFVYKLRISYKENKETLYWLRLLKDNYKLPEDIINDCIEISKILSSTIITVNKNLQKKSTKGG